MCAKGAICFARVRGLEDVEYIEEASQGELRYDTCTVPVRKKSSRLRLFSYVRKGSNLFCSRERT